MSNELRSYIIRLLDKGKRMDGRAPLQYRPIKLEYGYTKTAEGSAKIIVGETEMIAGVKLEVSQPYPDAPDMGTIMVGAELIPLANPDFEQGPPSIEAVELARVVDRGIRESKALDFRKLCLEAGEKAWTVMIDLVPLNSDGGLFDASALVALAALKDTKFPSYDGKSIDYKAPTEQRLEVEKEPIAVTVYKVGPHFVLDPTAEEEKEMDARLTITSTANGELCALQKGGDYALTEQDILQMADIALEKAAELRKFL